MRAFSGSSTVAFAHCADQAAGLEVVGREGRVGGVDRVERRVERDHQNALVARLLHHVDDRLGVGRGDQDAVGAARDAGLHRLHLRLVVAVDLAGEGRQLDAELLGLGRCALLHLDEERVDVGLGDQAGLRSVLPDRGRTRKTNAVVAAIRPVIVMRIAPPSVSRCGPVSVLRGH